MWKPGGPGTLDGMRDHCCEEMRSQVQAMLDPSGWISPDRPIVYDPVFDEYHVAGSEGFRHTQPAGFCPWCGAGLPPSRRDRWFAEVEHLGMSPDDPGLDDRYRSDAWWDRLPPTPPE